MNGMKGKEGSVQQHQLEHAHHILDSRAGLALLSSGKWMGGGMDGEVKGWGGGGKATRDRI